MTGNDSRADCETKSHSPSTPRYRRTDVRIPPPFSFSSLSFSHLGPRRTGTDRHMTFVILPSPIPQHAPHLAKPRESSMSRIPSTTQLCSQICHSPKITESTWKAEFPNSSILRRGGPWVYACASSEQGREWDLSSAAFHSAFASAPRTRPIRPAQPEYEEEGERNDPRRKAPTACYPQAFLLRVTSLFGG